jgi:MoaA/NifB/PqqE/SkfB family radical SAM enzyme
MSLEHVRALLPELAALRTRVVALSGGEPLLNPEWHDIAALLRSRGLELWLLTSGVSLAKHAARVAALVQSLTVSLDGTSAATYAAIRGLDAFDKVCDGIRAVAASGVPVGLRVTLQRANYRELPRFVTLAQELGAAQVSFLAVDVSNPHAFARRDHAPGALALRGEDLAVLDGLLSELERDHAAAFRSGFIAEPPAKLRRILDYFAALCGLGEFPPVRCNAPEFSAVIDAEGRVAPCHFIAAPPLAPPSPALRDALASGPSRALRASIRAGRRAECERCVCSMWRDPATFAQDRFLQRSASNA